MVGQRLDAGAAESSVLIQKQDKRKEDIGNNASSETQSPVARRTFPSEATSCPSQIVSPSRGRYSNIGVCKGRSPSSRHTHFAPLDFRGSLAESISIYIKDYASSEFTRKLAFGLIALVFQ